MKGHYSIYASIFLLRHSLDKKYFLLLTQFITEENFVDEQTIDTHQDFSIY